MREQHLPKRDGVIDVALLFSYKSEEMAGRRGGGGVVHHFGFIVEDVAAAREGGCRTGPWMGEPREGGGFYEGEVHDPTGSCSTSPRGAAPGSEKKSGSDPD